MNLLYRGPRAWLLWLNLLVACIALIPSLIHLCLWLLHESHGFPFGEMSAFPQILGAVTLASIGENDFLAGIPVLLASLLVPFLLCSSRIPWRARILTALAVAVALMSMFVEVSNLHRLFLQGRFRFFL